MVDQRISDPDGRGAVQRPSERGDEPPTGPGPAPTLAARLARDAVQGDAMDGDATERRTNPVLDDQETGIPASLREGDESAPRTGRLDAPGATYGADPRRYRIAGSATGNPAESVGGAMSDDRTVDEGGKEQR